MINKYLKVAWRNLYKRKGFSIANLLGLSIGIACTLFIMLWVQNERSWDRFHAHYDNIYQVYANRDFNGQIATDGSIMLPLTDAVEQTIPEVKAATFVSYPDQPVMTVGENQIKKSGLSVSRHFFNVFTWKSLKGNAEAALQNPDAIILTASTAKVLFGDADPINKTIRLNNSEVVTVAAILEDPVKASTFQFDFLRPFKYAPEAMQDWENAYSQMFLLKNEGARVADIEKKINAITSRRAPNEHSAYFTHPMSKWRLYSDFKDGKNTGGMIAYVKLFTIIAVIILLIACVNFMNLSTAGAEKRAKEIGIRKTLGSERYQLMAQFFFESIILAFLSFLLALGIVFALLPAFNQLVDKQLTIPFANFYFWMIAGAIIVFTGTVAGSYPAFYLSSFNPVKVLKGTFKAGKAALLPRRVLVVGQFVICIVLISATIIVYRQLQHVKNRDIGYRPDNMLILPASESVNKNYEVIKQELLQSGKISAVTRTSSPLTEIWNYTPAPDYEGKPATATNMIVTAMRAQKDFVKTAGMKIISGHDFEGTPADTASILLNEAAVKTMGLKQPIGMKMRYAGNEYVVTGVVGDAVMSSPYNPVEPMMILFGRRGGSFVNVRVADQSTPQQAIEVLKASYARHAPDIPFEFKFVDQEFGKKFITEELIGKLTNIFAGLAIFICCLGLSGLVAFTTQKRIREIGIRKVLGASVQQLLLMLSTEFLWLVGIAFLIAIPAAWWALNDWLQQYEYRTSIAFWQFLLAGGAVLIITLVTVCVNAIRAALTKPIQSLRSE